MVFVSIFNYYSRLRIADYRQPNSVSIVILPTASVVDRVSIVILPKPVSGIRDGYLGSWILSIQNPGSWIQQEQEKRSGEQIVVLPFFVATDFTKLKNSLFLIDTGRYRKEWKPVDKIINIGWGSGIQKT